MLSHQQGAAAGTASSRYRPHLQICTGITYWLVHDQRPQVRGQYYLIRPTEGTVGRLFFFSWTKPVINCRAVPKLLGLFRIWNRTRSQPGLEAGPDPGPGPEPGGVLIRRYFSFHLVKNFLQFFHFIFNPFFIIEKKILNNKMQMISI